MINNFIQWKLNERKEQNFSFELLNLLRGQGDHVNIMDVRELLELGADPNYKLLTHTDEEKINKFVKASIEDELDVKVPEMRTYKVATLVYPIFKKMPEVVDVMIDYGADPNLDLSDVPMASGAPTAFFYVVQQASYGGEKINRILDMFVEAGADVNQVDEEGNNAIHRTILNGRLDFIQRLIDIGVDQFKKNRSGKTPFDLIDGWSKYSIGGNIVLGSEAINMLRGILQPLTKNKEPKRKGFSIFKKA